MATCPTCQGDFDNSTFCPRDGSRLETTADAGALLGTRYRLIRRVGEGAMGVVFEAEHVSIHRRVAVKILRRNLVANREMVERLRREAQVTSGLGHPNIVECLDFGTEDGQVYLVMEWLDGETLQARLDRERLDVVTVVEIAAQTCAGLAEAHDKGVIHRDLKPANLFLTRDRGGGLRVKILDFGIAKLAAEQTQLTSTGVLVGTPHYMAPEQALGDPVDARADIYAVGIILYELLVGRVPFHADTPLAVLHQQTVKMPVLPSAAAGERGVSPELDALVMKCLAKAPAERFQTMLELGAALQAARAAGDAPTPHAPSAPSRPPEQTAPTEQSRPSRAPEADDVERVLAAMRPRRARMIIAVLAAVAVLGIGFALVVLLWDRDDQARPPAAADAFVPSSVVDASTPDALVAVALLVDAALPDAEATHARIVHLHTKRFAGQVRLSPEHSHHDQPITLFITLSDLDETGRQALATGRLRVRVTVEHFAKHDVVVRDTIAIDADGSATFTWVPRHGKHHISLEPLADAVSLGFARFDVYAD